jgi:DNA-binding response OmpR family regulator
MNKTILVIENDEHVTEVIKIILTEQGFKVKTCRSEISVLQSIIDLQPAAILLDVISVSEVGTELCRLISKTKSIADIPVIVLSTHPRAHEMKEVCADDVVLKPFDIDELVAALDKQLTAVS